MSRSNRFIASLLSGYGSIVANVVFTMASVPLALHYLDKEQFGLWALAIQINGYLGLIDLGMSSAVSRFAADHKDDVNGGAYGCNLLTGGVVFLIQGLLITAFGVTFSWFAPSVLTIPAHLADQFKTLLIILSATAGGGVALRSIGAPLWAFQRTDLVNGCSAASQIFGLALLWLGFANGLGVISFALAPIPGTIITFTVYGWFCQRNGYYPSIGKWGKPSMAVFSRVFAFGKDTVLISIGSLLINASQIIIISRYISLEAATTFAVATKFYTMSMLLVTNPVSASAPGLTELYVRGDIDRFKSRYWDLILMVLALATITGACIAVGNRTFVSLWTSGKVNWEWSADLLLGFLVVLRNLNGCFVGVFGLIKNWRPVRLILLFEGVAFVPMAILGANLFGITGVLFASLLAHLSVTTLFSLRAARSVIGLPNGRMNSAFISFAVVLITGGFSFALETVFANQMVTVGLTVLTGFIASAVTWHLICPADLKIEILRRFHKKPQITE